MTLKPRALPIFRLWKKKANIFMYLLLLILFTISQTAAAGYFQTRRITGRVMSPKNEAVNGASVYVKGTGNGTVTDSSGNFTLNVPANATLAISHVSFQTKDVPVGDQTDLTITMQPGQNVLEGIVVTGYGSQRRKDVTGSVASVSGAEIAKLPVQTPTQAIQGRVAGVQVITSGQPNTLPTVRVRGTGTMLGGVNPLYVVDGVITDDIRNINSADIVSMDILKDASATAIYGMRAANGVMIITTRKGRGKLTINYDMNIGLREATDLVDMAGPNQYVGYVNEASRYYGSGDNLVDPSVLDGTSTDWFDEILRKGFYQNHNIALSGSSDKISYFFSVGYLQEQGIVVTNKFNRFTVRTNNEYKFTKNLKLSTLFSYSRADSRDVNFAGAFNNAYRTVPYLPAIKDGKYGNTSAAGNVGNPLLDLDKTSNSGLENRIQGTTMIDYNPVSWLALRSSLGIDLTFFQRNEYLYKYLNTGPENVFIVPGGNQVRPNSQLNVTDDDRTRWVWDNTATITKKFDLHSVTFLAGITTEKLRFSSNVSGRQGVPANSNQWYLSTGDPSTQTNSSSADKFSRNSFISRLNYGYDSRLLLTATFRADGTSKFPEGSRWGYFPSVGLGWNIAQEKFMQDQKTFTSLKLRGSWGQVGNDQIPSSEFLRVATIGQPYFFNNQQALTLSLDKLVDEGLTWEVTNEFDIGVDASFLNNKLTGTLDFYDKRTKDALVIASVPAVLGDPNNEYYTNAATIQNKGVELGVNWSDDINKDWSYNVNGNIAFNKNEVLELNQGIPLPRGSVGGQGTTTLTDVGEPVGSFYLWQVDGLFQSDAEAAASGQTGARAGDLKYRDLNGDKKIDAKDRQFSGSYQPKVLYGINGGVDYKTFDLSINTYGTTGGKIYNAKKEARGDARDNIESHVARNRWTVDNPNTDVPRANLTELPTSTYFLEDGGFFRINNLTLGYKLPDDIVSKLKLSNLRAFVTIQNLVTFTGYSGFTPEIIPKSEAGSDPAGTLAAGIEQGVYPTVRTWAFGLNVSF
ncbi:TonB-dependent receptor [Chitinophagaceae bacterium LB-8]|uniref:TonB-dependent receptor n=1 Tax=Paraflavisolibacter caeni TaxID=2982496 RepID=A0A9X3BIZ8_9BACT|nr:TonB-dependent receptor [Paraflavisolibacter caeni]MCU7550688.1 TonB-dependent receptor [Paraflavisolibacter caeni]